MANVTYTVPNKNGAYDGDMVVKDYTNITIDAGDVVTTDQPCRGLLLFATGNITVNGTIDMTAKGASADPTSTGASDNNAVPTDGLQFPYLTSGGSDTLDAANTLLNGCGTDARTAASKMASLAGNGTIFKVTRTGGAGGVTAGRRANGPNGSTLTNGTGGGGTGGGGKSQNINPGAEAVGTGGAGTCFSGGSGGGGSGGYFTGGVGGRVGSNTGGAGGAGGDAGGGFPGSTGGGGAGNPGGGTGVFRGPPGAYGGTGETGNGGLIILIAKGNVTIGGSGIIRANGKNGASGGNSPADYAGGSGGGSGGGRIMILHGGSYSNSGTVEANGGSGATGSDAGNGGNGASGSITVAQVTAS